MRHIATDSMFVLFACAYATLDRLPRSPPSSARRGRARPLERDHDDLQRALASSARKRRGVAGDLGRGRTMCCQFAVVQQEPDGWRIQDTRYISPITEEPRVVALCLSKSEAEAIAAFLNGELEGGQDLHRNFLNLIRYS
jgi:hypothetical protein